jgi:N-methylhydantoinase B
VTPFGLDGGLNGGLNRLVLDPGGKGETELGMDAIGSGLPPGAGCCTALNGGGGFGPPHERAPESVLEDVADAPSRPRWPDVSTVSS